MPSIVAGAADLDPAAVLTAVVAGASFGQDIAWVVIACIPILWSVFSVSARLGNESRRGLVELVRTRRGRVRARLVAAGMVVVNLAMIIADLRAVSDAFSVILRQSFVYFVVPVGFSIWWILIRGSFQRVTRVLGLLALAQLAYVAAAALATSSISGLLRNIFIPHIPASPAYSIAVIALFGSLLTPDVIVWQTSSHKDANQAKLPTDVVSSHAGTFVAALISLSAVISASNMHIADPSQMTTRSAAAALSPLGSFGPILFSFGIIGSGLVALPVLIASMCYSIAESVEWQASLNQNPWEAPLFYIMLSGTVAVAVVINFFPLSTIKILYWSQICAGILTIPILWSILLLTNDLRVVSRRNSLFQNFWLGGAIGGTIAANLVFLWSVLH